jgi:hypothetical protein
MRDSSMRLGLLLLAISLPLMLGNLVDPTAEEPLPEIGTSAYLAGLLLAAGGNLLTLRGLGPGAWQPFLQAAIILDGLACVYPMVDLANHLPWTYLPSVPLHVAAVAVVIWAIGEVCFLHRLPLRRSNLIGLGIFCLAVAICFFVTADEGRPNEIFVIVSLLSQLVLVYPILKIRGQLSKIFAPAQKAQANDE